MEQNKQPSGQPRKPEQQPRQTYRKQSQPKSPQGRRPQPKKKQQPNLRLALAACVLVAVVALVVIGLVACNSGQKAPLTIDPGTSAGAWAKNDAGTGGMDMTSAFAAAGYDLQAFDASDMAYGTDRLLSDVMTATGPSIASNLYTTENEALLARSTSWSRNRISNGMNTIVEEAGKKIGFFSLASIGNSAQTKELTAADLALAASEQVAALQAQGADAILCIAGPDTDISGIYADLADQMKRIFGTKVEIHQRNDQKGKIEIEYYSQDELNRLIELIQSIQQQ